MRKIVLLLFCAFFYENILFGQNGVLENANNYFWNNLYNRYQDLPSGFSSDEEYIRETNEHNYQVRQDLDRMRRESEERIKNIYLNVPNIVEKELSSHQVNAPTTSSSNTSSTYNTSNTYKSTGDYTVYKSGGLQIEVDNSPLRTPEKNNYYAQQKLKKAQRDAEHQEWLRKREEAMREAAERERVRKEIERQRKYNEAYGKYMKATEAQTAALHARVDYRATVGRDFMYNYQVPGTEKIQSGYISSNSKSNLSTADIVDEQKKSRNNQNVIKLLEGKYYQSSSNWDEFMSQKSNFVDTEWEFLKKVNNLQDENMESFLIRVYGEAENLLNEKLKAMGLTKEEFADSLRNESLKLNNYYIQENANYNAEHDCLKKILLLAKYKVDYKATLNLIYQESLDKNPASQNIAKKNELFYREELEKSEKKLIEKGISIEDINRIKTQTENEALIKNKVSTSIDNIADGVEHVNDMMKNNLLGNIVSGIKEGVPLGVMVNDQITIESYKIVSDALEKQLDLMEVDHKKSKEFYKKRMNEIQTLSELVEIPSVSGSTNLLSSDKYESLKKGKKVYYAIECLKQSPPDINKKEKWEENNYFFKK